MHDLVRLPVRAKAININGGIDSLKQNMHLNLKIIFSQTISLSLLVSITAILNNCSPSQWPGHVAGITKTVI